MAFVPSVIGPVQFVESVELNSAGVDNSAPKAKKRPLAKEMRLNCINGLGVELVQFEPLAERQIVLPLFTPTKRSFPKQRSLKVGPAAGPTQLWASNE